MRRNFISDDLVKSLQQIRGRRRYFVANFGFGTVEKESFKVCQKSRQKEDRVQKNIGIVKDSEAYLTTPGQAQLLTPSQIPKNGYRMSETDVESADGNATFAFISAGAWYGDNPTDMGAYLGMASYVVQSGSVATQQNRVISATTPGTAEKAVGGVCISDLKNGECGDPRTFSAGEYKFSVFGRTVGPNYAVPAAFTHLAYRIRLGLVGIGRVGMGLAGWGMRRMWCLYNTFRFVSQP